MSKENVRNNVTKLASLLFMAGLVYVAYVLYDVNSGLKADGTVDKVVSIGRDLDVTIIFEDASFRNNRFLVTVPDNFLQRLNHDDAVTVLYQRQDPKQTARYYSRIDFWRGPALILISALILMALRNAISVSRGIR